MNSLLKKGLAALALAALCASPAWADDDYIETDEVKVTVNRVEQALHEVNVSADVITEEEMRRSPQTSIADLLNGIPGVMVEDGSMAGGKRVSIRGESSARTLILIDGVKISEQKSMNGASILIDTANIERIEVIKGPASVLYGSEAIGGVVNIITKKGGNKPIGGSLTLTADSSTSSFQPVASIGGSYEGFNYRFSASGMDPHDRDTPDGKLENTAYKQRDYSGQVGYDWDYGSTFFQVDYFNSDMDLPGADMGTVGKIAMSLPKWERTTYKGGIELKNFSDVLLKVKANAYYQNMKKDFINDITVSPMPILTVNQHILTKNDQDSFGGSLQTEWLFFDEHFVIAGVDFNRDDLDAISDKLTTTSMAMPPPGSVTVTHEYYTYKGKMDTIGLFVQDEWSVTDMFKIVAGGRYTWVKSEMNSSNDPNAKVKDVSDGKLVGNIGVVFEPLKELALRANVAQGYKFASINQLYIGTQGHGGATTAPNPDLKPEESINYEIGARWNGGGFNVDAAVYYSDAKNYITTREVIPGDDTLLEFINMNKAKTWGFELGADYTFQQLGLTPYVVFNWIQRETKDQNGYKTKNNNVPEFQGQAGIKWQGDFVEGILLFADMNYTYNSNAKSSSRNADTLEVTTNKYDSWGTLNLTLGFENQDDHALLNYYGTVSFRNMLDKRYEYSRGALVEPGFHVVATFGVTY